MYFLPPANFNKAERSIHREKTVRWIMPAAGVNVLKQYIKSCTGLLKYKTHNIELSHFIWINRLDTLSAPVLKSAITLTVTAGNSCLQCIFVFKCACGVIYKYIKPINITSAVSPTVLKSFSCLISSRCTILDYITGKVSMSSRIVGAVKLSYVALFNSSKLIIIYK